MEKVYVCIDLKSFYASVECKERNLDPLTTNLVVADSSRTEKTICLAVSPSLKEFGLKGRARLFEVVQKVREINKRKKYTSKSYDINEIKNNKNVELDFIIAKPRMQKYIDYSTKIYNIYLKYLSKEDIYVYSIDEVFMDITNYLNLYKLKPVNLVTKIIKDVYDNTGITATAGIGTNLFLAKIAMDIGAKHTKPNSFGVRMAYLDEIKYRKLLWNHKPLTDFWRVGNGYYEKLKKINIYTMGDIARLSLENEDKLYKLFGVNAELLIDHAWGYEPCTLKDIKNYKPRINSVSKGQVLHCAYDNEDAEIIIKEMIETLCLDLIKKKLETDRITLTIGYDISNMNNYSGPTMIDRYGREVPKHFHKTINLTSKTSIPSKIKEEVLFIYRRNINKKLMIKRINISANNIKKENIYKQIDLFTNYKEEKEENKLQNIMLEIKNKYGKNSILKAMDLQKEATTIDRNKQIGGHSE